MPNSESILGEINLKGLQVWLSGAVPESEHPSPDVARSLEVWGGSSLEHGILGFVQEFSSLVFKFGGTIVHGSHPTLTQILLRQARQFSVDSSENQLELYVSKHFSKPSNLLDWKRWELSAKVERTPSTGEGDEHRDPSLAVMREQMAARCNAFVAIGGLWWHDVPGRAGVPNEFALAKDAGVPCFVLGGFGGASATYVAENPDWSLNLRNGLSREQSSDIAKTDNFSLAAGRLVSQLHLLHNSQNREAGQ